MEVMTMPRKISAVVLGVVVAVILITAIESLGHMVYPPPNDLDPADTEALQAYVMNAPIAALLLVMSAWIIATLAGGLLAASFPGSRQWCTQASSVAWYCWERS
jgi:hypothetical protein